MDTADDTDKKPRGLTFHGDPAGCQAGYEKPAERRPASSKDDDLALFGHNLFGDPRHGGWIAADPDGEAVRRRAEDGQDAPEHPAVREGRLAQGG
jgi:hypothetical protein